MRNKTYKLAVAFASVTAIVIGVMDVVSSDMIIHRMSGIINVCGGVIILGGLVDDDCARCHIHNEDDTDEGFPKQT